MSGQGKEVDGEGDREEELAWITTITTTTTIIT
jgi:hypothetical protein